MQKQGASVEGQAPSVEVRDCNYGLVGDHELAGEDGSRAVQLALVSEQGHEGEYGEKCGELDLAGGLILGQRLP